MTWVLGTMLFWAAAWALNIRLAASRVTQSRAGRLIIPAVFGLTLLGVWEGLVHGLQVPAVILPPPSAIAAKIAGNTATLWVDFVQTFVKGALSGYAIGCLAAILVAVLIDRSAFLRAGLLPVGNFVSALPIVGISPI
ncbi:MAG: ABC transporter permease, partial [Rhodobacter sp.]|nr:ABC transporter permease [Rhodobacter sp.]